MELVVAADAEALRALRDQSLSDAQAAVSFGNSGIPITYGTLSAALFLRDELPYEDERGLWPVPGDSPAP